MDVLVLFQGVEEEAVYLVRDVCPFDAQHLTEVAAGFNSDARWCERGRAGAVLLRRVAKPVAVNEVVTVTDLDTVLVMLSGRGPASASYAEALRQSMETARTSDLPPAERDAVVEMYMAALRKLRPPARTSSAPPPVAQRASSVSRMYRALLRTLRL